MCQGGESTLASEYTGSWRFGGAHCRGRNIPAPPSKAREETEKNDLGTEVR